ncbi:MULTISPECIES: LPXTG cell wall anchor domain-containing protein [unclassified Sphingomonas]|jgi:LPXTG-motif cell wall-anchored protein|nr:MULTISPECIES: LPXTG cell wall anchor domain-containing protein [unclassified Sphingomonas]
MAPSDRVMIAGILLGLCLAILLGSAGLWWRRRRRRRRRSGMSNYFQE